MSRTLKQIREGVSPQGETIDGIYIPPCALNISRIDMPQISKDKLPQFIDQLRNKHHVRVVKTTVPVDSLYPTQKEFNIPKIKKIMNHHEMKPKVIMSNDNHVLDGHHTWLGKLNRYLSTKDHSEKQLPVTKINLPIKELLKIANNFNGVFHQSVAEGTLSLKNPIPVPLRAWNTIKREVVAPKQYITPSDMEKIHSYCDNLFAQIGLDVAFSKHFFERVNDARNGKPITCGEIIALFNKEFHKNGKIIASMKVDDEGVLKDTTTHLNAPIVIKYNKIDGMQMMTKSIMRKTNFIVQGRELRV